MTSAISLTKYLKLRIKERSWLLILISLVSFLAQPVYLLMRLQLVKGGYTPNEAAYEAKIAAARKAAAINALGLQNGFIVACVIIAALLAAFTCFTWLYQKEKSDFTLGLAISRQKQFASMAFAGILIAVVPYVLAVLISVFVICPVYDVLSVPLIVTAFKALGWWILSFLAIYFVVIAVLLLTGRYLPGVLLTAFILGYGPCLVQLILILVDSSFSTYYTSFAQRSGLSWYLSPVTLLVSFAADEIAALPKIAVMAGIALIGCLISKVLFVKRPAETAGASLTYPAIMSVLKVIVTVPCAVVAGILFESVGYGSESLGWMFFGGILGAVIVGGIMEFIESYDLKMILKHWKSGLIAVIGALAILLIFRFDPFGYDRFLPEKDELEAMAIAEETYLSSYGEYYSVVGGTDDSYSDLDLLDLSLTDDLDSLYALAESGVTYAKDMRNTAGRDTAPSYNEMRTEVPFLYKMKSGRRILRVYSVPVSDLRSAVNELAKKEAYREALNPASYLDTEAFDMIHCTVFDYSDGAPITVRLSEDDREALKEALLADMASVTADRLYEEQPLATMGFVKEQPDSSVIDEFATVDVYRGAFGRLSGLQMLYIYPSYEKTAAFLESKGIRLDPQAAIDSVVSLEVTIYGEATDPDGNIYNVPDVYRVTDPEAVAEVCALCRRTRDNDPMIAGESADLYYTLSTGSQNGYTIKVTDWEKFTSILQEKGVHVEEEDSGYYDSRGVG